MTAVAERSLPQNLDAERSLLGVALVTGGSALDDIADAVRPQEFFRDAHRRLYEAMLALHARDGTFDFVTLNAELHRRGDMDEVGGPAVVAALADGFPASTNVPYYIRLVKDANARRDVINLSRRLLMKAYGSDGEVADLVNEAELGLLRISEQAAPGDLVSANELVQRFYPEIQRMHSGEPDMGVSTGLAGLDRYTLGFGAGETIILAGLTSSGKTSLAMQIALHVAKTVPVAYFSLEMSQRQQMLRIVSTLAQVDGHKMRMGRLDMFEQQRIGPAMANFAETKFWLSGAPGLTALQVRSRARRMKSKHGLGLLVVDYLQKMKHPPAERHDLRVGASSEILSQLAVDLGVPALVLSQFSRGVAKDAREPQLSDLRDSGSIEQDAGMVLLLHRPPDKNNGMVTESSPTKLIIAKQRNGPKAEVDLVWLGEQYRFGEMEDR